MVLYLAEIGLATEKRESWNPPSLLSIPSTNTLSKEVIMVKRISIEIYRSAMDCLHYLPETGRFVWKYDRAHLARKGELSGTTGKGGYRMINHGGVPFGEHRLVWFAETGEIPYMIDHVNGDRSDNRFCNLRECNASQNCWNQRVPKNNKSGAQGVSWCKRRKLWRVYITVRYKQIHLGYFTDKDSAIEARMIGEEQYHGDFASGQRK